MRVTVDVPCPKCGRRVRWVADSVRALSRRAVWRCAACKERAAQARVDRVLRRVDAAGWPAQVALIVGLVVLCIGVELWLTWGGIQFVQWLR